MPMTMDAGRSMVGASVRIGASAVAELFWLVHGLGEGHHHRDLPSLASPPVGLVRRVRELAANQKDCFDELFPIAEAGGQLLGEDVEAVLRVVEENPAVPADLPMRSETPEDRQRVLTRVRRLHEDADHRAAYVQVLRDAWALVADDWEREGREIVAGAVRGLEERQAAGIMVADLLNVAGAVPKEPWRSQALAAAGEGRLVIVPGWLSGKFLALDLERNYLVGCQAEPEGEAEQARRDGRRLAGRLKVIADPTRLAILLYLTPRAATVSEVARAFGISQPTASTHLRLLREAGLVTGREEGRGPLSADPAVVKDLVGQAQHLLVGDA